MPVTLLGRSAPIIHNTTRRQLLIGGAGLAALLAGCSSTDPATGSSDTDTDTEFSLTVSHKYGSTDISGVPERVVSVGLTEQDFLLALGITPVATREWFGEQPGALWPWARTVAGNAPTPEVLSYELNYEKIAALRPDLIVGVSWGITEQEYPKLAQIAPTVAQSGDFVDGGTPWQEQARSIGRAVDRQQRAEELIAGVEARFARVRTEHPQFVGATAIAAYDFGDGSLGIYGPQDPRARILTELGFEVPPRIAELVGDRFYAEISAEQLELLEADALVWISYTEAGASRIQEQPLYRSLSSVMQGRDIFLIGADQVGAAYAFSTVLSLPVALEGLVPQLVAAVDGDPATTATG
ncbi:MAG: iron-siderophore ABC transporter substrate-binding protein [Pseudonocardiaceae bacterium]